MIIMLVFMPAIVDCRQGDRCVCAETVFGALRTLLGRTFTECAALIQITSKGPKVGYILYAVVVRMALIHHPNLLHTGLFDLLTKATHKHYVSSIP